MSRQRPLLAVWAIATLALTAVLIVREERQALSDPVQKSARGEVRGLDELSLLRSGRFFAAMRALGERYPGGRITSLRLTPVRIDVVVRTPDFKTHSVDVDTALDLDETSTGEGVGEGPVPEAIFSSAPQNMLREVNALTRTAPEDVDYLVLQPGDRSWSLFLARGPRPDRRGYIGDSQGSGVRLIGEPPP